MIIIIIIIYSFHKFRYYMSSFTKSDEQVYNLVMELANHSPKWTLCYNSGLPYGVSILINRTKVRIRELFNFGEYQ